MLLAIYNQKCPDYKITSILGFVIFLVSLVYSIRNKTQAISKRIVLFLYNPTRIGIWTKGNPKTLKGISRIFLDPEPGASCEFISYLSWYYTIY